MRICKTMIFPFTRWPYIGVVALCGLLALTSACGASDEDTPVIIADSSLADVLPEAGKVYEAETGRKVEFRFGGTTFLANQAANEEVHADGFIADGDGPVQLLVDAGKVEQGGSVSVARNSLAVVGWMSSVLDRLQDLPTTIGPLITGLAGEGLEEPDPPRQDRPESDRLAIADPNLSPAGQYAREALQEAGVWEHIKDRIVPMPDVRAALTAVSSRVEAYAIVYRTDAITDPGSPLLLEIDPELHGPIEYTAVGIADSERVVAADEFFEFLLSEAAQNIFKQYEFLAP